MDHARNPTDIAKIAELKMKGLIAAEQLNTAIDEGHFPKGAGQDTRDHTITPHRFRMTIHIGLCVAHLRHD